VDWVVDAAANPSVLAGVNAGTSAKQLMEHNLGGTLNLLEFCRERSAGLILLSTSRVYSIRALASVPVVERDKAFVIDSTKELGTGVSSAGVSEEFSTVPPVSLYGSTKRCSELLALEYSGAFNMPLWINRCGVMAGGGQFGKPEQGIFAYWIHAWAQRRPLKYIGFGGSGFQVRDCMHPSDLARMIALQVSDPKRDVPKIANVSGGAESAISLAQLSDWCAGVFGPHDVAAQNEERPFDIPWAVLDSTQAREAWGWAPKLRLSEILTEISEHTRNHPDWLEISGAL
jgi:CDP-paratose 2-epimerase